MVHLLMTSMKMTDPNSQPLHSWSWQEIYQAYKWYGCQLNEYKRLEGVYKDALSKKDINYAASFFSDIYERDINRLDLLIDQLDKEIARRNTLIGVVG